MSDKMMKNIKAVQNAVRQKNQIDVETLETLKRIEQKLDELLRDK